MNTSSEWAKEKARELAAAWYHECGFPCDGNDLPALEAAIAIALDAARRVPEGGVALIDAERHRQISVEGWTTAHDDEHVAGELSVAAACYAAHAEIPPDNGIPTLWPWDPDYWKPTPDDRIRELVKAGALIVAEIERLTRTAAEAAKGGG